MKTRILFAAQRFFICAAMPLAMTPVALSIKTADAAEAQVSGGKGQPKTKNDEPKKASLKIEVVVVDAESKQSPQPFNNAMVKIIGEEDSYTTDKDGKTQRFAVMSGVKTVLVHLTGVKPCNVDLVVKEGRQDVTVLVETLPKINCTLKPD